MAEESQGNSPLFAVFFLSLYSLFVIPYTIYKLCNAASADDVVKPWEAVRVLDHPLRSGCAAAAWGVCFSLLYTVAFTLWPLKYKRTCPPRHAVPRARQRRKSALERFAAKFFTPSNVLLALLWVAWLGLVVYVQSHAQESVAFDPFHILQARRRPAQRRSARALRAGAC